MNRTYPWMLVGPVLILGAATLEGFWLQHRRGRYDWRAYFASLGDLGLRIAFRLLPLGLATSALNWLWGHRLYTMPLQVRVALGVAFCRSGFLLLLDASRGSSRTLAVGHALGASLAERTQSVRRVSTGVDLPAQHRTDLFRTLGVDGVSTARRGRCARLESSLSILVARPLDSASRPAGVAAQHPSASPVHHASNPEYLDANFGGVLIVFDRWFGTYREELADVPLRYGLVDPVKSYNPLFIGLREWISIGRDVWSARSLRDVFISMFGAPRPKGIAVRRSGTRECQAMKFHGLHRVCKDHWGAGGTLHDDARSRERGDRLERPGMDLDCRHRVRPRRQSRLSDECRLCRQGRSWHCRKPSQRGQVAFGVSGLHSDTPTTSVSDSSTASGTTATTSGQLYFRYGVEALRGGIAFNTTRDQDYRDSQAWTGMLHSGAHGWAIDLDVSTRQTHFDGFPVSGSEVLRQDQTITTDGNANCTLHDIGYGGSLTYTIGSWSAYGSGSANKYDNTACSYSVAEPNALQRLSSYDFQSLSGALLDRAQLRAGGSDRSADSVIAITIWRGHLAFMGARGAGIRLPACQG
jgi:hypothetical protein